MRFPFILRTGRGTALVMASAMFAALVNGCDAPAPTGPDAVARVAIALTVTTLRPGRTTTARAFVLDRQGNELDLPVTWSSLTPTLMAVDADGELTALAPGTGMVRAAVGSVSSDVSIPLVNPPAEIVQLADDTLELTVPGVAMALEVTARDSEGQPLVGVQFVWNSDAARIATVSASGLVTPQAVGHSSITATVDGVTASRVVRVVPAPSEFGPIVNEVLADEILPGVPFAVLGDRFSPVLAGNAVLVDGLPATVTSASTSQLTVVLAAGSLPCVPTRDVSVQVTTSLGTGAGPARLRVAPLRTLAVGESLLLTNAADAACSELAAGEGRYVMTVQHAARALGAGSLALSLHTASGLGEGAAVVAPRIQTFDVRRATTMLRKQSRSARAVAAHQRILEGSAAALRGAPAPTLRDDASLQLPPVNGIVPVRIPDLESPTFCSSFSQIGARAVYESTHLMILEDTLSARDGVATLAGQMDNRIAELGLEFENVLWPLITRFGNPLVMDGRLDANNKIVLVLTPSLNAMFDGGVMGAVVTCDFFTRAQFPSSNVGELMYLQVPESLDAIDRWRYEVRGTIAHELKHIVGFGERIIRGQPLEEFWLEEATARHAEELFARALGGINPTGDVGYSAIACEVRALGGDPACADAPRAVLPHFEGLYGFLDAPATHSPLGPTEAGDRSFYGSAWSLTRWALDHAAADETEILRGLTTSGLSGLDNLESLVGRSWDEMLGRWSLALVVESRDDVTPLDPTLQFPSWNLASVFSGLCLEAGSCGTAGGSYFTHAVPLQPLPLGASATLAINELMPGSFVPIELAPGVSGSRRLLKLRALDGGVLPSSARLAILRVE